MDISRIECRFLERRRMKAARSWRCFLELPDNPMLAVCLTALIEREMTVKITSTNQDPMKSVEVDIDPAYIVDVPSKGRRFQIVIETVYEHQSNIGPHLTALTGTSVFLSISPLGDVQPEQNQKQTESQRCGNISERAIKGLHVTFFKNASFADFLRFKTGRIFSNGEHIVKTVFKEHMGVESCTELNQAEFDFFLKEFNQWLKDGGSRG